MGLLKNVDILAEELEKAKINAIKELAKECKKYENKSITYISKKPRMYTIKLSDLGGNWSPEYHDYQYQFKAIIYVFLHTDAGNLVKKWEQLKAKGVVNFFPSTVKEFDTNVFDVLTKEIKENFYDTSYTVLKFNPKVIEFIDNLLYN